jgi:hypothetical protein
MKWIKAEIDGQTFYPVDGKFNFPPECNGKRAAFTVEECTDEELEYLRRLNNWSVAGVDGESVQ